jgi:predicted RNA-binding Zn-ribbon protein involved in translation (DUF1610 family)
MGKKKRVIEERECSHDGKFMISYLLPDIQRAEVVCVECGEKIVTRCFENL